MNIKTVLLEAWKMMELEQSIPKQFHDDGPEGIKIFSVDGEAIRNTFHDFQKDDFIGGGHHLAYDFIPENEIWIEQMEDTEEQRHLLAHELAERMLMKHLGKKYIDAHHIASNIEMRLRAGEDPTTVFDEFCKTHFKKPELQGMGKQLALAYLSY